MTRLVLCRHPAPGGVLALGSLHFDAVYASPLARARDAAAAVAADVRVVDDLREIDFGDVEGLGFDELPADLRRGLLDAPTQVRFPGGETYGELKERVTRALDDIVSRHDGETVLAVSHAGAIRAALAVWLQMADDTVFRIDQRHGAVNVVDFVDGTPIVRLVNGERP